MQVALEGGVGEAIKANALEKVGERFAESDASATPPTSFKERAIAAMSKVSKFGTKFKILVSLWQILQGIGSTFAIPFVRISASKLEDLSHSFILAFSFPLVVALDRSLAPPLSLHDHSLPSTSQL